MTPPPTAAPDAEPWAVVVVSYGSSALINTTLTPLGSAPDLTVVVVDNYSTASERAAVTRLCAARGWLLVTPAGNDGFGAGVNAGATAAAAAGAQTLVLLNPDATASQADLRRLVAHCGAHPDEVVAPTILRPDGTTWFAGGTLDRTTGRTRTADARSDGADGWLTGACLAMRTELWLRIGGFDDRYFMYWEDIDLSWRARTHGATLAVRGDVTVVHAVGGTQGDRRSDGYFRYNTRNRLLFAAAHLRPHEQLRWVRASLGYATEVVRRGGRVTAHVPPVRAAWFAVLGTAEGLVAVAAGLLRGRVNNG